MIDKESETIESLVSLLLTFTPDQMVAFVAGAREIIAKYTPKNWEKAEKANQQREGYAPKD